MRIAYLLQAGVPELRHPPYSGPALHVRHVVAELQALGHQVLLLAQYGETIWRSADLETFRQVSVPQDRGLSRLMERAIRRVQFELRLPYAGLFSALRFVQACRQELADCDLLYERMGWMGYAGAWAARRLGLPHVLEVNGDHLPELEMLGLAPRGMQRRLSVALTGRAARSATHTVAAGAGWARQFCSRWGVAPDQVTVIENGSEMVDLLQRQELRAFQPVGENRPVTALFVGTFDPWQGLDILLPVMDRPDVRALPLRLVLVGSGPEEGRLRELVDRHQLHDRVVFAGRLGPAQLAEQLREADIGLSTYCGRDEFSGLKLLDYKAAGLPTIASGKDGQPAVIAAGETGLVVQPCAPEPLAEALARLTRNAALRRRLGRQARLEAEAQHSWRHTAEAVDALFTRLVAAEVAA